MHRYNDRIYVVAHNFERLSKVWVFDWPDLNFIDILETNTEWAHNCWISDMGIVVCNSKHGKLTEISTDTTLWTAKKPQSISRGLAVNEDYIFIGRSEWGQRGERHFNSGGIWILDRKTFKEIELLNLPGSGCVNDIRLIDCSDECHNGHPFDESMISSIKNHALNEFVLYNIRRYLSMHRKKHEKINRLLHKVSKLKIRSYNNLKSA